MTRAHILVIGAGVAGLAAAHELSMAGLEVTVIEGRDRMGGRVHTLRDACWPFAIEAGTEFLHGNATETEKAIRSLHLATQEVAGEHYECLDNQMAKSNFEAVWNKVASRLESVRTTDLTFAEFLRRHCADLSPQERSQVSAYVEGFEAADLDQVSASWVRDSDRETGQGEGARRLPAGYDRIADYFRNANYHVHLNQRVTRVRWRSGAVEVETFGGDNSRKLHRGRAAILTLPLGVLQATPPDEAAVSFEPDLPEKRVIWNQLKMGHVIKLAVSFRRRFWLDANLDELSFLHTPQMPFMAWWTGTNSSVPFLMGWSGGPRATQLARLDDPTILQVGLDSLATACGKRSEFLSELVKHWKVFDWQRDAFSRGAYSYVPSGGRHFPEALATPVELTLFFAGEATHSKLGGTVSGAIATGYRAANQVLQAVN